MNLFARMLFCRMPSRDAMALQVRFSAIPRVGGGDRWGVQAPPAPLDGFPTDIRGGVRDALFVRASASPAVLLATPTTFLKEQ